MIFSQEEFYMLNKSSVEKLQKIAEGGNVTFEPPKFKIKITIENCNAEIWLHVTFLEFYPIRNRPEIYLKHSGDFSMLLEVEMKSFVEKLPMEPSIFAIAEWIKDNAEIFKSEKALKIEKLSQITSEKVPTTYVFMREWLYFIGFYTKSIRDQFVNLANELNLKGFLMSGKPALACLEGDEKSIEQFIFKTRTQLFATVPPSSRKMSRVCTWKTNADETSHFGKFEDFREVIFDSNHSKSNIADLSRLKSFLREKGLDDIFDKIFETCI